MKYISSYNLFCENSCAYPCGEREVQEVDKKNKSVQHSEAKEV